jgi:hypothetical protein
VSIIWEVRRSSPMDRDRIIQAYIEGASLAFQEQGIAKHAADEYAIKMAGLAAGLLGGARNILDGAKRGVGNLIGRPVPSLVPGKFMPRPTVQAGMNRATAPVNSLATNPSAIPAHWGGPATITTNFRS